MKWDIYEGVREEELVADMPVSIRTVVLNYIFDELFRSCVVFPKDDMGAIATITSRLQKRLFP